MNKLNGHPEVLLTFSLGPWASAFFGFSFSPFFSLSPSKASSALSSSPETLRLFGSFSSSSSSSDFLLALPSAASDSPWAQGAKKSFFCFFFLSFFFSPSGFVIVLYRVTLQVVQNLPLTLM